MKKFIITSVGFTGEVHIVFGADNLLMIADFSHAQLNAAQVHWFIQRLPTLYFKDTFSGHFNSDKITIVESTYVITFKMFWEKYGRKIHPHICEPLWNKMSQTDQLRAYHGLTPYFAFLDRSGYRSKADPKTYIKNKVWLTDWSKER